MSGPSGSTRQQKKSPTGLRCMFSFSPTIQLALKFALAQPHPVLSHPRQRPLVMLLVKSFAILGMLVLALQLIHSVSFTMHVAGAGAIIVLLHCANNWRGECKTMLSDDLGEKKFFAKGLEFLHLVFNVIEKRGPVFLSLVFASFIKTPLGKPSGFSAYAISRKRSEA